MKYDLPIFQYHFCNHSSAGDQRKSKHLSSVATSKLTSTSISLSCCHKTFISATICYSRWVMKFHFDARCKSLLLFALLCFHCFGIDGWFIWICECLLGVPTAYDYLPLKCVSHNFIWAWHERLLHSHLSRALLFICRPKPNAVIAMQ